MISLKQLSYAVAVEKTLHFKKAAELSNISQSALSTAILELEKQLGLNVFERNNKKVFVTPIGKEVLARANKILQDVEDLKDSAEQQQAPLSFPLSIGIIPTICPFLLPRMLPVLRQQYPHCELNIIEDQSHVLLDKVQRGEIDTAILALPFQCDGLLTMEFWQENFYWVSLKGDKLSKQKKITNQQLQEVDLLLLNDGHCLKDHALEACKLSESKNLQGLGASSLGTLIQMVLGGFGSTLIPEIARDQLLSQHKPLTTLALSQPGPHRRLAFILRPNYTRMSSIEALVSVCKEALANT